MSSDGKLFLGLATLIISCFFTYKAVDEQNAFYAATAVLCFGSFIVNILFTIGTDLREDIRRRRW
jgi:hypothetical protein